MKTKWFEKCSRVPWQPPDFVFKFVWPILYALYGYIIYKHWNQDIIRNILLIGLILNLTWVPVFITNTQFALIIIIAMIIVAIKTLELLYNNDILKNRKGLERSSILFIPYLSWLLFALSLNTYLAWKC